MQLVTKTGTSMSDTWEKVNFNCLTVANCRILVHENTEKYGLKPNEAKADETWPANKIVYNDNLSQIFCLGAFLLCIFIK